MWRIAFLIELALILVLATVMIRTMKRQSSLEKHLEALNQKLAKYSDDLEEVQCHIWPDARIAWIGSRPVFSRDRFRRFYGPCTSVSGNVKDLPIDLELSTSHSESP